MIGFIMKKAILVLFLVLFCPPIISAQRINTTINSVWRFHKGDINTSVKAIATENWQIVNLPHTWNDRDAFDEIPGYYRGTCWYVKELRVPLEWKEKRVVLQFEGANQKAEVYLNGNLLGDHIGGYTAFAFDLTDGLKYGEVNTVLVKVDNEHDENIPPLSGDFTFYGGIYRNVRLIVTEPVHFEICNDASDGVFVETPLVNEQKALVTINGSIENNTSERKKIVVETLIIDKDRRVVAEKSSRFLLPPESKTGFSIEGLHIPAPKLWSPESPYLYQTITQIREEDNTAVIIDKAVLPLGIRWFEFDNEGSFLLNGKPLKLIGANRHQDFEDLGNALPDSYHYNDLKTIKTLGFNFVRLAHYPQAPEVYRACDELGLLVWSEIPIVNEISQSREFSNNCLHMQQEHIRQTRNHPCVIFYGYMNEVLLGLQYDRKLTAADHQQTVAAILDLAKKLNMLTKTEAPDRFTAMALHYYQEYNESGLTEIPDVVGWNLYFGWYYEDLGDLTKFLSEQHARYPKRPMIVSEFGPGADTRIHAETPAPWDFSEDYQNVMHASYLKQMMDMPYLSGFAVWNFADFGSDGREDTIPSVNQKGILNFNRTEKDVCGLYRAYFTHEPVLHIASRNYAWRTGLETSEGTGTCIDSVWVFSNQDKIELLLNGKTLGQKKVEDHQVSFEVPFKNGRNLLNAIDENGHSDQIVINYNVVPLHLNPSGVGDLAINVGARVSFFDPGTKVMWIPDRAYTPKSWGYVGGVPFTKNDRQLKTGISQKILGTDCNPLFQTFVEGIKSYRFDVPDGKYRLTLCFAEYISRGSKSDLINNFSFGDSPVSTPEPREFGISINGKDSLDNLNLERDYGDLRAVTFDFIVIAENGTGIKVDFHAIIGKALLNGIRISSI